MGAEGRDPVYFRLRRLGTEHIPDGGVILASNHRSFLDPFAIGCCLGRPIYFVAKQELFKNPLLGWLLNCLGAFPIKRGASDEESVATSLALLERGQAVVIFPEGTRIRTGSLAQPRRGVGRLALESGSPVVPIAVTNSEHARRGWRIKPVKVHIRCGPPITFPTVKDPSPFLAGEVTERIWPCVGLQWEWLGGLPPLRTAAVVGAGSMGTAAAVVLARAGLQVQLGCRTGAQAEALCADRENTRYLPGLPLASAIDVKTVPEIELAGVDLVVLAVPCASLPAALGEIGARMGDRSAVLVTSRAWSPRSARRLPRSCRSASARGPSRRSPVRRMRARRSSSARPWCSPRATPTSAASSTTSRGRRAHRRGHRRRDRHRARRLRQERRRPRQRRRRPARREPRRRGRRPHLLRGPRAGDRERRPQRDLRGSRRGR